MHNANFLFTFFRMPEPVMGPKQIKPEYLNRAKSPPKAPWEEIPDENIPD